MSAWSRWSIRTTVFVAPSIIIVLMLGAMLVFDLALRKQQASYREVVQGPLTVATTTTTRLLLSVSEVQAAVLRYAQLRQRLGPDDPVLGDLRESILDRYEDIARAIDSVKASPVGAGHGDVVANIEDFLTIHRAVSMRMFGGAPVDTMSISTIMAHYQQLQGYISELAERSLDSALATVERAEREVSRLARMLAIGAALVILLSIGITIYVGRAISRPISQMIDILSAIAAGDRVTEVPGRDRRDEIGEMARAVGVFDAVTRELRDHERSLDEARRAAEAANLAKSAFLTNVSHELRTPLTSILGFTRLIQRRLERTIRPASQSGPASLGPAVEEVSEHIGIILAEGERLTSLINNLLDLEKIEAGEMRWEIGPVDASEVLSQAVAATSSLLAAKGLSCRVDADGDVGAVRADRDGLIQVLVNLISNAVKFTSQGGIRCAVRRRHDGFVEFSVADTGRGIAPEDQEAIFEKFRQVGDTLTDKPTGTGLGLPICREIVKDFGGEIWVESEAGKGSTFRFVLPGFDEQAQKPQESTDP
ncbi:ATP-binding protein [Burkholderiaceae bacterium FT117]|uniref:sensor histidine kinase n=1 Tax=Zeimonas sediminis TaxID=2944268 RepID=UPI002342D7D2|nr:ATP-binding protein [Zeimonas sediminis]MCM5570423.1 ATP-binding protein [Zeimonas sediminis]